MKIGGTVLLLSLLLYPPFLHSAPFCSVVYSQKKCIYYTLRSCYSRAGKKGTCTVNPSEISFPPSSSPFCVVTSPVNLSCSFYNRPSCERYARARKGVCVPNPKGVPSRSAP